MVTIIGYTDSIQACECCGKTDLKGTYCLDIDGEEFYYGSVCAFKSHGISEDDKKTAKKEFEQNKKKADFEIKAKEMHIEAAGYYFKEKKVVSYIIKKGIDLKNFLFSNCVPVDNNQFFTAFSYGGKTHIFNK